MAKNDVSDKSLESWLWDAACSIRGAQDAAKYKDFILPLVFAKRLCDVFDDEVDRITRRVGSRAKAFKLVARDPKLVRFFLPFEPDDPEQPVWSVIRTLSTRIGEQLTSRLREIARANQPLEGIIDRIDFNATTHGQRDISDDRLSNLIENISEKWLGLADVEPDIIGRSYEYLIRKFAEGAGQSAGEFYTPREVGMVMAQIMDPEPGMTVYDPCCGSAGLLIKCQLAMKTEHNGKSGRSPLKLYGQESTTPARRAFCYLSTRPSPRRNRTSCFWSTLRRSSPRAIQKTTSRTTVLSGLPRRSWNGRKRSGSASLLTGPRSPRTTTTSPRRATSTPPRLKPIGP